MPKLGAAPLKKVFGISQQVSAALEMIRPAAEFESDMSDIKASVKFSVGTKELRALEDGLLGLTSKIPMAFEGFTKIAEIGAKAGLGKTRQELVRFTEDTAKIGVAFKMTGAQAADMVAGWRTGMQLSQERTKDLSDAVSHLAGNMGTGAADIGTIIQNKGMAAMSDGLTETQVASLASAFLAGGSDAQSASNALGGVTSVLSLGKYATDSQKMAFSDLGLDAQNMADMMQTDAPKAIKTLFDAIAKAPEGGKGGVVNALLGSRAAGAKDAVLRLAGNTGNLKAAFGLTQEPHQYKGATQETYKRRNELTKSDLSRFDNQMTRLKVAGGTPLLPDVKVVVQLAGATLDQVSTSVRNNPGIVRAVVAGIGLMAIRKAILKSLPAGGAGAETVAGKGLPGTVGKKPPSFMKSKVLPMLKKGGRWAGKAVGSPVGKRVLATGGRIVAGLALASTGVGLAAGVAATGVAIAGGLALLIKNRKKIKSSFVNFFKSKKKTSPEPTLPKASESLTPAENIPGQKNVQASLTARPLPAGPVSDQSIRGNKAGNIPAGIQHRLPVKGAQQSDRVTIHFNPTINAGGQDPEQVRQSVTSSLTVSEQRLREMLRELLHQERRLSYA